jgi:hypothetical protein
MKIWCVTEKTSVRATVNYEYVKTTEGRLRRLACNDCKLCKCVTVL